MSMAGHDSLESKVPKTCLAIAAYAGGKIELRYQVSKDSPELQFDCCLLREPVDSYSARVEGTVFEC